jgi:flagellar basal body P-ring formation protein FlgA
VKTIFKNKIIIFFCLSLLISNGAGIAYCLEGQKLDQEKLNNAIKEYIEKSMPWPAGAMRFEVLSRLPDDVFMPAGKFSWRVASKSDEGFIGDVNLLLKLYVNGIIFREDNVRVRIEVTREFVVSSKVLTKDTLIKSGDVSLQKKWVRSIPINTVSNLEDVIGKTISISIRPNAEITRNMLKEALAVKRGKLVQVLLDNGALSITSTGLSEEDGVEGSLIKVRNLSSNKTIYARVVGDAKVRVDF